MKYFLAIKAYMKEGRKVNEHIKKDESTRSQDL